MGMIDETISAINNLSKKSIAILIPIVITILIVFPIINSLLIVPAQVNIQYDMLIKLREISKIETKDQVELKLIDSIKSKAFESANPKEITLDFPTLYYSNLIKFYSSIILWAIVFVMLIFQKQKLLLKIGSLILVAVFAFIIGYIGLLIPDIVSPWVNYFGFPIIQVIFLAIVLNVKPKT